MDATRALLRRHARLDCEDADGWRAMHHAAHTGCIPVVQLLLDAGASQQPGSTGASVLHVAAEAERLDVLQMLLRCAPPACVGARAFS